MVLPNDEVVEIDVIINAQQANQQLKALLGGVESIKASIKQLATQSGASFGQVGNYLKQLYANQIAASGATKEMGAELKRAFNQQVNSAVKELNQEIKDSEKSGKGFHQVLNLIRGTLVAIGVFRVFNFIEESIRKAIETAKEFETSLYRLSNVERILSQQGIETSVGGLRDGIKEIKDLLPIFSENDITQQVSLIGIMTKELGVTEDKVLDIAKAIGVLNVRSAETEDLMTTTNKVLTALVAPSGRGIASLGLDFGEANIEATAFRHNILAAGESFKDLTDNEKDMLKIAILLENTGAELETINEFLKTSTGRIQEGTAAWEDFLGTAGQAILPFQAGLADIVTFLGPKLIEIINVAKAQIVGLGATAGAVFITFQKLIQGNLNAFSEFGDEFDKAARALGEIFFPASFADNVDTSTESVKQLGDAINDISELKGFDDLVDDLGKLQQRVEDLNEDFSVDQSRKWEDYQIDIQRIVEDYAIKRQRIIEDSNEKIDDSNKKFQARQLDDEARFQEQMRQLREKFLFNLEDALRERDARQVLRLQRQYQMDKTALENEHALRKEEQARQHQEDIQRIKDDRDDRLAELAEEERIRLQREREDYELKKQREEEDHQRDLEDLRRQISERLAEFERLIGEEYNLNEQGLEDLHNLLEQYYGPQGYFDGLYDYSYGSMVARAQQMLASINQIVSQATASLSALPLFNPGAISSAQFTGANNIGPQADGGTYLATRPTTATFGEAGPEIAQFIPVRKLKAGTGAGSMSGGGLDGQIQIEMLLSPDLEARVIRNSMNGVAEVVAKVRRTKQ